MPVKTPSAYRHRNSVFGSDSAMMASCAPLTSGNRHIWMAMNHVLIRRLPVEHLPRPYIVDQLMVVCALLMATGLAALPTLAHWL